MVRGYFLSTGEHQLNTDSEVMKMAKKKQPASVPVEDGLFFPEDFRKLHKRYVIYIKQGVIIDLDKLWLSYEGPLLLGKKRAFRY